MDEHIVTLTEPAKIDGRRHPAGKTMTVSWNVKLELAAAGAIDRSAPAGTSAPVESGMDLDAAIAAAIADRDADWSTALDHFETMAFDRQDEAIADLKVAHEAELQHLEGEFRAIAIEDEQAVAIANARVTEMKAQLHAAAEKRKAAKTASDQA